VTGGRERERQDDNRVERVGWMVKSSRRYVGWEDCRELLVSPFVGRELEFHTAH